MRAGEYAPGDGIPRPERARTDAAASGGTDLTGEVAGAAVVTDTIPLPAPASSTPSAFGELELVVTVADCSTVFANGPALAHASDCGLVEATLAGLLAFREFDDLVALLDWVAEGIDGSMVVPLVQAHGGTVEANLTLQGLRTFTGEPVTTASLRISPIAARQAAPVAPASVDALTGLLGRPGLLDALRTALAEEHELTAVMFVDMDHFKRVNDTRGHHAGDLLLAQFADRLRVALPGGAIARFGGDEFVVVLPSIDADELEVSSRNVLGVTEHPFRLGAADVTMSASVGIATIARDDEGRHTDRLLREADIALFEAKRLGRGRVQRFTEGLRQRYAERTELEDSLRTALDRRELYLVYQPQIDLRSGRVVSVEALARWRGPDGENIPPDRFIPVAEETGIIGELGFYVLDAACRQMAQWRKNLERPPSIVAVNVSPQQLNERRFVDDVRAVLSRHGLPPTALCLELTESGFEGLSDELEALHELRELGCYIGIDDFGTGYSSLARLRDLPVEILKIDRRFVSGLGIDPDDTAIVSAIMSMALTLGLHVIAEGVELAEQAEALTRLGCPVGQGYLFARPELPSDLRAKLMRSRIWKPMTGGSSAGDRHSALVTKPRRAHRSFIREFLDHIGVPMEHEGDEPWGDPRITIEAQPGPIA